MHNFRKITQDMYWIGASDRRISLFENVYPLENGVSYNSYIILDNKTVLLDTVDKSVSEIFFENLEALLNGRKLDYVIINHMEPDHAATLGELILRYPEVTIVGNSKTLTLIKQFFSFDADSRFLTVSEGSTLSTGRHDLTFAMAPMVHWPEAMVTYDPTDKVLYSADAFGTFGALSGNIFADEVNFKEEWLPEARRYYTNIVGKYGKQVLDLLNKAAGLDIQMICPLHGPVWREDLGWFIDKYVKWASYTPEEEAIVIAVGSVYGNTERAAEYLSSQLAKMGVRNIKLYDTSKTHPSYIIAEAFRASHLVFASATYNMGIFVSMENLIYDICAHNLQNRTIAVIENGSWSPASGQLITKQLVELKDMTFLDSAVTIRSAQKSSDSDELDKLALELFASLNKNKEKKEMSKNPLFDLSYGLFVLSAKENEKDNGCIVNTVMQVTDSPQRLAIGVNKSNYTHGMIERTGKLNISILSEKAEFETFKRFGFASGKDTDKFADLESKERSANGIFYLTEQSNAYFSCKVERTVDLGTHSLFIVSIDEMKSLSSDPSVTYAYYHKHIKPQPAAAAPKAKKQYVCSICGYVHEGDELPEGYTCPVCGVDASLFKPAEPKPEKKKWVCDICGYVYEGDELPADYICPLCKHGADDFSPVI